MRQRIDQLEAETKDIRRRLTQLERLNEETKLEKQKKGLEEALQKFNDMD